MAIARSRWHSLHAAGIADLKPEIAVKPAWPSGWHGSGEFRGNYGHSGRDPAADADYARLLSRAYAASVSYMDAQVGRFLAALRELGLERDTIVVVWSDHGFLLGEHAIRGKHGLDLFTDADGGTGAIVPGLGITVPLKGRHESSAIIAIRSFEQVHAPKCEAHANRVLGGPFQLRGHAPRCAIA